MIFWEQVVGMPDPNWLAVLLTAASVALFVLAIVLAVLTLVVTVFGMKWVKRQVKRRVDEAVNEMQNRALGITAAHIGFILADLREIQPRFLDAAIRMSRRAYMLLPAGHLHREIAMNNLAFFYSLRGNAADAPDAIKFGTYLRNRYSKSNDPDDLTTYASVTATYYKYFPEPEKVVTEAITLMEDLIANSSVSEEHKQNARRHLIKLRRATL